MYCTVFVGESSVDIKWKLIVMRCVRIHVTMMDTQVPLAVCLFFLMLCLLSPCSVLVVFLLLLFICIILNYDKV